MLTVKRLGWESLGQVCPRTHSAVDEAQETPGVVDQGTEAGRYLQVKNALCFKSLNEMVKCALCNKHHYRNLKSAKDVCCTFKVMRTSRESARLAEIDQAFPNFQL